MPRWVVSTRSFAGEVISEFNTHECLSAAASLAYYTVFSLAPILLIVIVVAGLVLTPEQAATAVHGQFEQLVGADGADQIRTMVEAVQASPGGNLAARVFGGVAVLFGATGVMVQLQSTLNRAWGVRADPRRTTVGWFFLKRLMSLAMILAIAFLLLVSLALTAVLSAVAASTTALLPAGLSEVGLEATNSGIQLVIVTTLFAAMFRWMPDARLWWTDALLGAFVTALLFTAGRIAIGVYLGNTSFSSAYGAASSLAIVFVWVYYSAVILLLGAEFTQVWARRMGHGLHPVAGATFVERTERDVYAAPAGATGSA